MSASPSQLPGRARRPASPAPRPCSRSSVGAEGCCNSDCLEGRLLFFSVTQKCFPSGSPKHSPSSLPLGLLGKYLIPSAQCFLSHVGDGTSTYSFPPAQGFKLTGFGRAKQKQKKTPTPNPQSYVLDCFLILHPSSPLARLRRQRGRASPGWPGLPSGRRASPSWAVGLGDTCDGGARRPSLRLPPAPPVSCLLLGSFGAVWAAAVLAGSVDTARLTCSRLRETPPSRLPREEPSGPAPSDPWLCPGLPPSPAPPSHGRPLARWDVSQRRPEGETQQPERGRPIGVGRDPGPCPKERRPAVAGASPGGTRRDFLGSPLHLRQINWSQSQETHRLPGTLRAVRTAVPAPRTHAKQSL